MKAEINLSVFDSAELVAKESARYIAQQVRAYVEQNGACHVVLPGGTTPARCLEHLSSMELPWEKVHWYPGDERCYPIGHSDRNDTMISNVLFSDVAHQIENFHPIPAELGAVLGAEKYDSLLDSIDHFDLVILGMGEDGHTASLFPGNDAIENDASAVPVFDSPKPPSERVSISMRMLRQATEKMVIATGDSTRPVFLRLYEGEHLPVGELKPDRWFVDRQAVKGITDSM